MKVEVSLVAFLVAISVYSSNVMTQTSSTNDSLSTNSTTTVSQSINATSSTNAGLATSTTSSSNGSPPVSAPFTTNPNCLLNITNVNNGSLSTNVTYPLNATCLNITSGLSTPPPIITPIPVISNTSPSINPNCSINMADANNGTACLNQTTPQPVLIGTPKPPQVGEYLTVARITITFSDQFIPQYNSIHNPFALAFLTPIVNIYMNSLGNNVLARVTDVQPYNMAPGSVIVTLDFTFASVMPLSVGIIQTLVTPPTLTLFGGRASLGSIIIIRQFIFSTSTTSTTTTGSTSVSTSTATDAPTPEPAKPGEIKITISITCSFNDFFEDDYRNRDSDKYRRYTHGLYTSYYNAFKLKKLMRLLMILFYDLSPGSVVANMSLVTGSDSKMSADDINSQISATTSAAFGSSATIKSFAVTSQEVTPGATGSPAQAIQPWGIALIVIFSLLAAVGISIGIIALIIHLRTKDSEFLPFVNESNSVEMRNSSDNVAKEWSNV